MAKAGKRVFFDIPGFGRVASAPGAETNFGGVKRDAKIADTGVVGYTEEPVAPEVTFKLPMMAGLSIKKLNNLTDVNVTVTFDTGQVWVMQNGWTAEPCKISGGDIDMKMSALQALEVN
jgi:hypothetical protein